MFNWTVYPPPPFRPWLSRARCLTSSLALSRTSRWSFKFVLQLRQLLVEFFASLFLTFEKFVTLLFDLCSNFLHWVIPPSAFMRLYWNLVMQAACRCTGDFPTSSKFDSCQIRHEQAGPLFGNPLGKSSPNLQIACAALGSDTQLAFPSNCASRQAAHLHLQ